MIDFTSDRQPFLCHRIPVTDGNGTVFLGLVIDGYTEGCRWHPCGGSVYRWRLFFIETHEASFTFVHQFTGDFRQSVFFISGRMASLVGAILAGMRSTTRLSSVPSSLVHFSSA